MQTKIIFVLTLVAFMISGPTMAMAVKAKVQTLPTCIDPTGHNYPCIMFISTLPPPKDTLKCQEASGQIFKCTFIVDKLSNGNKVVAITIYVPANFVFKGRTVVKVVLHETIHVTTIENPKPVYDCSINAKGCDGEIYCSLQTTQTSCYDETDCPNASPYCKITTPTSGPSCNGNCSTPPVGTTQTCPDGSVIDSTAKCPTNTPQLNPNPSLNSDNNGPIPPPKFTPAPNDNGQSSSNGNDSPPPSSDKGSSGSKHIHIPKAFS